MRFHPIPRLPQAIFIFSLALGQLACVRTPEEKYKAFMESGQNYVRQQDFERAILQYRNASRAMPKEAEPHYQIALAALSLGRFEVVGRSIKTADRLDPRHVGTQMLLAQLSLQTGDPARVEQAEQRAKKVLDQQPNNSEALYLMAATKARAGSLSEAEELLQDALRNSPEHLRSTLALARVHLARNDIESAEQVLRQAVQQNPNAAAPAVLLGQFHAMMGRREEAQEEFRRALMIEPGSALALIALASLHLRAGEIEEAEQIYQKVAALPDKKYRPVYGQVLLQHGKTEEAIAEFRRLWELDPSDRQARSRLVAAYMAANQVPSAERVLTQAFEHNAKDTDALLQRAEIYWRSGKLTEAQDDITQVLEHRPNSLEAHYLLSKVHASRREPLLQRQELSETLRINTNYLPARIDLANSLLHSQGADAALKLLAEAPEAQRGTLPFVVANNWIHLARGDRESVRQSVEQGLATLRTPDLLMQDGVLKWQDGRHEDARRSFREALDQSPEDVRALQALAESYLADKQPEQALAIMRRHAAANPESARLQFVLGEFYLRAGEPDRARDAFRQAKESDPLYAPALLALARLDVAAGRYDDAGSLLSEVRAIEPGNTAAGVMQALIAETRKDGDQAFVHYQSILQSQPDNVVALNNLAYRTAVDRGEYDEALKYARRAKEVAPDNPSVDDTLGWIFYLKGVYRTALSHLESAASRQENNATVHYHLAMARMRAGQLDQGRAALERARQINPDLPEAVQAEKLLAEVQ